MDKSINNNNNNNNNNNFIFFTPKYTRKKNL